MDVLFPIITSNDKEKAETAANVISSLLTKSPTVAVQVHNKMFGIRKTQHFILENIDHFSDVLCGWILAADTSKQKIAGHILGDLCEVHPLTLLQLINNAKICLVLVDTYMFAYQGIF